MKKMTEAQKFSLIKREAIYTALALVGLIIFWLVAGFGTANFDAKIFHLPLWVICGTVGVWIFAILLSFILSRKLFTDIDLNETSESNLNSSLLIPNSSLNKGGDGDD